ncbi:MAG: type II/IV secretion system protein [Sulfuricurvum sp.]|nr:type II/IV secretion system protein [Sulfuricurvum sp.]
MKRFAFTMLELVFVIIVIGILAVLAMPNFNRHPLQEAAEQIASHIRYTQHLAMVDDKFDPADDEWWQKRWQIHFENAAGGEKIYVIYNNLEGDTNEDDNELARDPLTRRLMKGTDNDIASDPTKYTGDLMISKAYGISGVSFSADCHPSSATSSRLGFDNLGRPYYHTANSAPYDDLLIANCNITLTHSDGTAVITIRPETGYVSVTYP